MKKEKEKKQMRSVQRSPAGAGDWLDLENDRGRLWAWGRGPRTAVGEGAAVWGWPGSSWVAREWTLKADVPGPASDRWHSVPRRPASLK